MKGDRAFRDDGREPRMSGPLAEINVFEAEEVVLVEQADGVDRPQLLQMCRRTGEARGNSIADAQLTHAPRAPVVRDPERGYLVRCGLTRDEGTHDAGGRCVLKRLFQALKTIG